MYNYRLCRAILRVILLYQCVHSSVRKLELAHNVKTTLYQRYQRRIQVNVPLIRRCFNVVCRLGTDKQNGFDIGFLAKLVMSRHQQIYPRTNAHTQRFCNKLKVFIKMLEQFLTILDYSLSKLHLLNIK